MTRPFVCSKCFRHLERSHGQFRDSSFVSLGKLVDRDDGTQAQIQEKATVNVEKSSPRTYVRFKRQSFAQQYQEERKSVGVDKVLETLFSSNRAQAQTTQLSRYSRRPKPQEAEQIVEPITRNSSIRHRLFELHNQLQRGTSSLEYIWDSCLQVLGERRWANERDVDDQDKKRQHAAFQDILLAICSKQRVVEHGATVTPRMVIQNYIKHGVMRTWWHKVIWFYLGQLSELRQTAIETTPEKAKKGKLLAQELEALWALFMKRYWRPREKHDEDSIITYTAPRIPFNESLEGRFVRLVNRYPEGPSVGPMAAAAIMSHDFLDAEGIKCTPPLGDFFAELRKNRVLDLSITETALSEAGVDAVVVEKTFKSLEDRQWRDKHDIPVWKRDEFGERKAKRTYEWNLGAISKRLVEVDVASKRADPEDAVNLWENFIDYLKSENPQDKETNSRIFAKFLRTFWALRCSNEAITVWNRMLESGQTPAQMHWTAMLSGCVPARDATSMQDIWRNMMRSKFTPDMGTWTTYIHGLIKLWKWQEGLEALESLGRLWKGKKATSVLNGRHSGGSKDDPFTPNLSPVHAALSALTDIKKPELHATVIAWAEAQNLCLETYTFNILLQPLVRHGTQEQVRSHLQKMAAHNCAPDIITFTIILNGLVSNPSSNFHTLPPSTQESTIISILKDMEEHGFPANAHTYTTLLDGLLNPKPWKEFTYIANPDSTKTTYNVPAARTILAHMQSRNLTPSPHHYTILISHYFAYKPPDIAAIGSLWAGIRHSGQTQMMDDFFYDRMIEGYADHDEIEKALQFLRRVPDEGKKPSWWALYRVLAALERGGDWDLCTELMQDIEDPKGLLRHGQGMFRGKKQFYELVDVLRERGITMGESEQI